MKERSTRERRNRERRKMRISVEEVEKEELGGKALLPDLCFNKKLVAVV